MERDELRAIQAPLKERYREEPGGRPSNPLGKRQPGRRGFLLGKHRALFWLRLDCILPPAATAPGSARATCCFEALGRLRRRDAASSRKIGLDIPVKAGKVHAQGDLDFRGTMAVDREAAVGFRGDPPQLRARNRGKPRRPRQPPEADRALLRPFSEPRQPPGAVGSYHQCVLRFVTPRQSSDGKTVPQDKRVGAIGPMPG